MNHKQRTRHRHQAKMRQQRIRKVWSTFRWVLSEEIFRESALAKWVRMQPTLLGSGKAFIDNKLDLYGKAVVEPLMYHGRR